MFNRGFAGIPDIVKNLLIINLMMFAATEILASLNIDLRDILGLHYFDSQAFEPFQFITYLFMHGSFFWHLAGNMFALYMFGSSIENAWGPKKFLIYYLITGFGAGILHFAVIHFQMAPEKALFEAFLTSPDVPGLASLLSEHDPRAYISMIHETGLSQEYKNFGAAIDKLNANPLNREALNTTVSFLSQYFEAYKNLPSVVGASGSVFGILLAFGMLFPNMEIYLMFIPVPIKAKYLVAGYGFMELYSGLSNDPGDNVAHFAHLGGMLFGFLLIKYWRY